MTEAGRKKEHGAVRRNAGAGAAAAPWLVCAAGYAAARAASAHGAYIPSGTILIFAALVLYFLFFKKSGMLLDPAALFSLSWVGGSGLSAMKLSRLQTDWVSETWICLFLTWFCFAAGYLFLGETLTKRKKADAPESEISESEALKSGAPESRMPDSEASKSGPQKTGVFKNGAQRKHAGIPERLGISRVSFCALILTAVSVIAFAVEAVLLSYIPLFTTDTPHAYSYFHISGLHYFTVSCVLVPSLAWLGAQEAAKRAERLILLSAFGISFLIPILCVSRFQMIFAAALLVFTAVLKKDPKPSDLVSGKRPLLIAGGFLVLGAGYLFLTVERAHSVSYLNGIFEMKDPETPIWITQPYMYVANNFDNLNCLIRDLPAHTHGLRMLFPVFALSGLKFLDPSLVSFPLYVTKEELTTVTLLYDAYYDFGLFGTAAFSAVLGFAMAFLAFFVKSGYSVAEHREAQHDPVIYLLASQLCFYCLFAFFTTWYSNPATWFYLAVTAACAWYCRRPFRSSVSNHCVC